MKSLLKKLINLSNWKVILISGLVTFSVYLFVGLFTNHLISSGNLFQPHKVLQSQLNYSGEKAFEILNSYSSVEKRVLMTFTVPCDFIIALLYGIFLSLVLSGIYKNILKGRFQYFFLLPLVPSALNILENMQILLMMFRTEKAIVYTIAPITNVFTMSKLLLLQFSMLAIGVGILILLVYKLFRRRKSA